MSCCNQKQVEEVDELIQDDNEFDVANVRLIIVLFSRSGDAPRQDVSQKNLIYYCFLQTTSQAFKRIKQMSLLL